MELALGSQNMVPETLGFFRAMQQKTVLTLSVQIIILNSLNAGDF